MARYTFQLNSETQETQFGCGGCGAQFTITGALYSANCPSCGEECGLTKAVVQEAEDSAKPITRSTTDGKQPRRGKQAS